MSFLLAWGGKRLISFLKAYFKLAIISTISGIFERCFEEEGNIIHLEETLVQEDSQWEIPPRPIAGFRIAAWLF